MKPSYDYYVDVDLEKIISDQDRRTLAALIFKLLGLNQEFQKKVKSLNLTKTLEKQKEIEWH